MNLFSRLFTKESKAASGAPAATSTPQFKAPSKPAAGVLKIPRAARIQLSPLHRLRCKVIVNGQERDSLIANLSASGVGLLTGAQTGWPTPDSLIQGSLEFPNAASPVTVSFTAKIIHVSPQVLGAHFEGETDLIREEVRRYFKVELGALRMSKVAPDMLKKDADGEPHWSYGDNGCEIFYLTRDSKIVRFNLAFFGNYAEGGDGFKTRFGQIVAADTSEKLQYKGNEEIRWDAGVPADLALNAVRFVESVSHLAAGERASIISLLQS